MLTLSLFAIWVRTFRMGRVLDFGWLDFAVSLLWVPLEAWIRPWPALGSVQDELLQGKERRGQAFAIMRGALLAIPILFVFTALLGSADLVFGDLVERALDWLNLERLLDIFESLTIVILSGLFLLGATIAALRDPLKRKLIGVERALVAPFLGFTESAIVLGAVDLLFAAFVAIQFHYLFGGAANINAAGYTYSEYARRGFGELVATAFLTLGMIMVLGNWSRREGRRMRRWFNALSGILVGLVSVMLVSAFQRLLLYERAFGFTRLRTYTHAAIVWMGALFLIFLALLLADRLRRFAPAVAFGALGFAATLNLINVDRFIVQQNIARWERTGKLDAWYLSTLSEDALPELAASVHRLPQEDQDLVLAELACRRAQLLRRSRETGWQSFRASHSAALASLVSIQDLLTRFPVTDGGSGIFDVETEDGPRSCTRFGF